MSDNVLVTGQTSFGAPTSSGQLLLQKGHQVVAIDDLSTGRLQNIQHRQPLPHFQFGCEAVANTQVLDRLTSEVDTVIHLATAVDVKLIVKNPTPLTPTSKAQS